MRSIVAATGNRAKLIEMRAMLAGRRIELIAQTELGVIAARETGATFVDNAVIKARNACRQSGLGAIADDSGLEVDALGGAPGVYSARYAGEDASDEDNMRRLLAELARVDSPNRAARFCCAIVYARAADDPAPLICTGEWRGEILSAPRGDNGFGYDPLFYLAELDKTSAQLSATQKNRISHRAIALSEFMRRCPEALS